MVFVALGETDAIGASCLFLKVGDTGIMLDAGADPEEDGPASVPRFEVIHNEPGWYVDHVLITHAHHDHIGSLPVLIEEFPHVMVHMTRATRDLAEFILPASARLQQRKLREGSATHEPLFTQEQLEVYSYLYLTHEFETPFDVTGIRAEVPVKACFYNSGHILGAAGVLLTFEEEGEERRVFYTSDTNLRPQTIMPSGDYPEPPVDVLILESTLGSDPEAEQTTRRTEEQKFKEMLQRVIARGGAALVPVFALGRAQEMLALIDRFKQRGDLPEEVPVYTAGGLRAIADIYDKSRHFTPRLNPDFEVFGVEQRRLPRSKDGRQNALNGPCILVFSSGMMFERTLSNWAAQHLIQDEKNGVLLVGFAKEDSPADRVLMAAEEGPGAEVVIDSTRGPQPLHAEVGRFRFSGHSHRRDLIQLVEKTQPKKIILVHGETEARQWMADNIQFFYPEIEILMPKGGEPIDV